jgi:hypothetical protein
MSPRCIFIHSDMPVVMAGPYSIDNEGESLITTFEGTEPPISFKHAIIISRSSSRATHL